MKQRTILLSAFSFGVGLTLLLALGVAIPKLIIDDDLGRFTGIERRVAERALDFAGQCFDHPIERGLAMRMRVVRVELRLYEGNDSPPRYTEFALVRTYTLFGIPTRNIFVWAGEKTTTSKPPTDTPRSQSQKLAAPTSPTEQLDLRLECRGA